MQNNNGNHLQIYYLQTDHLNTPRIALNSDNAVVWRWDAADPFGNTAPNQDPDGDGTQVEMNLRFPGQYYDVETGLHYNYFRDYNPATGRYIASDPIGLRGGLNTYGYVGGNPASRVDQDGRFWWIVGATIGGLGDLSYQLSQNGGNLSCVKWEEVGQYTLAGASIGALASLYKIPATLYHFTSIEAATAIAEIGVINSGSGLFDTGVYASSLNSSLAATLMGAASTETSIVISTEGITVYPTLIPGAFRIIGIVTLP